MDSRGFPQFRYFCGYLPVTTVIEKWWPVRWPDLSAGQAQGDGQGEVPVMAQGEGIAMSYGMPWPVCSCARWHAANTLYIGCMRRGDPVARGKMKKV